MRFRVPLATRWALQRDLFWESDWEKHIHDYFSCNFSLFQSGRTQADDGRPHEHQRRWPSTSTFRLFDDDVPDPFSKSRLDAREITFLRESRKLEILFRSVGISSRWQAIVSEANAASRENVASLAHTLSRDPQTQFPHKISKTCAFPILYNLQFFKK